MKIKTLIASIALVGATSTAALADRDRSVVRADATIRFDTDGYRGDYRERDAYRYERRGYNNNRGYNRGYDHDFRPVTEVVRQNNEREDFWVQGMRASTIKLAGVSGRNYVDKVVLEFGPGTTPQVVEVNRTLRQGEELNIDVAGRARSVQRIAVFGSANRRGAYQVLAR